MLLETHAPRAKERGREKRNGERDRSKENEREGRGRERDEDKEDARGCEGKSGMRRRKREIEIGRERVEAKVVLPP